MTRDRNKARRQHKNQAEDQLLHFQLPTRFRHTVYHPSLLSPAGLSEELFISTFFQKQTFLSHSDHLLIPNPEYQSRNSSIPCYAAFRLKGMVSAGQQETLYTLVQNVWDVGLRSHTIASRGADFHQWWFDVWCRYAKHSVILADSRQKGSQKEVLELVKAFDGIFGDKPRSMLHRLDKKVAISMAHNH
ncbi:hypothetical protein TREMEDRAFT_59713 [Tremella mesenterica DSM 1558]|uniref:uncharacterized protein n=1 Tax=Tremella mesenterica (strain ATCC 24925 / CBS 8224 / DSM 1558 / NBRC 9311 / NRRL Y-6157 / RJB 2259-6 / UBC 559-6) TaxID=578456 RepID=UPI0003F48C9A|nr:uncharacterized protein TREMEDRAFT_59713 [Tremella mesenterica DSM 1558]EIW73538.1 hypothetical protein TREMEDRAFT_59713 [Tremella mesenterica DSM 1558]